MAPLGQNELCRDLKSSFGSVRDTLVHILSAEFVWCSRWHCHSPTEHLAADEYGSLPAVRARWVEHERKVRAFIATLDDGDADGVFEYRVFSGQWTSSVLSQMLQHLVNHASYHRGQVTAMLRQLGATPPKSQDLITFYRVVETAAAERCATLVDASLESRRQIAAKALARSPSDLAQERRNRA